VARRRPDPRRRRRQRRAAPAGGLAGRRRVPGRRARTCSPGAGGVACLRAAFRDIRARSGRTFADVEAVRDWLTARERLHRPDRRARLLHGRRLRAAARPRPTASPAVQRQLRPGAQGRGPSWCPAPARWWQLRPPRPRPCAAPPPASTPPSPPTTSRTTSRSTRTPATRSSTTTRPGDVSAPFRTFMHLTGMRFRPEAAADARTRIATFFTEHLTADADA